jgi:hypothetical protein
VENLDSVPQGQLFFAVQKMDLFNHKKWAQIIHNDKKTRRFQQTAYGKVKMTALEFLTYLKTKFLEASCQITKTVNGKPVKKIIRLPKHTQFFFTSTCSIPFDTLLKEPKERVMKVFQKS